jgi:hypothetical protein
MTSIYPKFPTKWETAKKIFNAKMRELDNDGSKAIQYFIDQAARSEKAAKVNPASSHSALARRMHNCATYGINLAFGIDKAAKG